MTTKPARGWAVGLGAAMLLIGAAYLASTSRRPITTPAEAGPAVSVDPTVGSSLEDFRRGEAVASMGHRHVPGTAAAELRGASYLNQIAAWAPRADAGDPQAQYDAASAIDYCRSLYGFYFLRNGRTRTLDEALQWASTRTGVDAEEARLVHARCEDLMREGTAWHLRATVWMERSAESGHALALVHRANAAMRASAMQPDPALGAATTLAEARARAERDLRLALAQREPAAAWAVGELQGFLGSSEAAVDVDGWAWRIAACRGGYDCSDKSDAYRFACRFDLACQPGESIEDVARRILGSRYQLADESATVLAEQLAAGSIAELPLIRRKSPAR